MCERSQGISDEDKESLQKFAVVLAEFEKVKEELYEKGMRWFSLDGDSIITQENGTVTFWLNPYPQLGPDGTGNHYGRYTLDELIKWGDNQGPVVDGRKNS